MTIDNTMPRSAFTRDEVSRPGIAVGITITFLLHTVLIGLVVWGTMAGEKKLEEEIEPKMLRFEEVDLLALGEEKPPNELPRIANPEPEVQPPDEINLAAPEEPVVDLKKKEEKEVKEDEKARKKRMLDALSALHNPNRPTNEDIPEGSEKGAVGGTISDAAMANLLGTFQAKLLREISKVWEMPSTISPGEAQKLAGAVEVFVRLSESGHIVTYRFVQKSENQQFNSSIERVLKKFQVSYGGRTLPVPDDPAVRKAVLNQGLKLTNWEYTGR